MILQDPSAQSPGAMRLLSAARAIVWALIFPARLCTQEC